MRIAFLAPTAGPAFMQEAGASIGGAERQMAMLGRAMTERGHQVDLLVADDGKEARESPCGRIWPLFPLRGIPLLKLVHPKGSSLLRFLKARGSELLLQRGASELSALGAAATRRRGIPFLFMLASDRDLDSGREILPHPQDRVLFHESIRYADFLVSQTRVQAVKLWRGYGRKSLVMPSFLSGKLHEASRPANGDAILWGGNLRRIKRPEWLLELAKRFPNQRFLVFGGAALGSESYARGIVQQMEQLPNLSYLGQLPSEEIAHVYRRSRVLVNTSVSEGFPNTFLEAWRHGLAVISTVDPDGLLSDRNLGVHASTRRELSEGLEALLAESDETRRRRCERSASYLNEYHTHASLADKWEKLLKSLLEKSRLQS